VNVIEIILKKGLKTYHFINFWLSISFLSDLFFVFQFFIPQQHQVYKVVNIENFELRMGIRKFELVFFSLKIINLKKKYPKSMINQHQPMIFKLIQDPRKVLLLGTSREYTNDRFFPKRFRFCGRTTKIPIRVVHVKSCEYAR
jgi:hypothetical protein